MVHFARFFAGLKGVLLAALVLYCLPCSPHAQAAFQPAPDMYEGIMPAGITWNKPLKAGDLTLPQLTPPERQVTLSAREAAAPPALLKAPRLSSRGAADVQAPRFAAGASSTQGMMMLHGMRAALAQYGQNPDLHNKTLVQLAPSDLQVAAQADPQTVVAVKETLQVAEATVAAEPEPSAPPPYNQGQEPKSWAAPAQETPVQAPVVRALKDGYMEVIFPDSTMPLPPKAQVAPAATAPSTPTVGIASPKITDLDQAPQPLEQVARDEKKASPVTSIFGKPVDEDEAALPLKETQAPCEPSVQSWVKSCADVGYPPHFVGEVTGETRTECPSGQTQDIWLTNKCAPPSPSARAADRMPIRLVNLLYEVPAEDSLQRATAAPLVQLVSASTVAIPAMPALVNGVCGAAHDRLFEEKPVKDLCEVGKASAVEGDGPWRWRCIGSFQGEHADCAAGLGGVPSIKAEGLCGPAAGQIVSAAPEQDLCALGTAGEVTAFQKSSWRWICKELDSGKTEICFAPMKGGLNIAMAEQAPERKPAVPEVPVAEPVAPAPAEAAPLALAAEATPLADVVHEEAKEEVIAASPVVLPRCGLAADRGTKSVPTASLCLLGKAGVIEGQGPWRWRCSLGENNSVDCEAPKMIDGICGAAHGSVRAKAPAQDLCTSGTAEPLVGQGPWQWNCMGIAGGSNASCLAQVEDLVSVDGICGAAANKVMTQAPDHDLCESGAAGDVLGDGPWSWSCEGLRGGAVASCATLKTIPAAPPPPGPPIHGACGFANGALSAEEPTDGLCTSGITSGISGDGPWNWSCLGTNGGLTVSCTAPLLPPDPIEGVCGSAHGKPALLKPESGLCEAGIISAVSGTGPWTWSCSGTNGGSAASCVAPSASKDGRQALLPSVATPPKAKPVTTEALVLVTPNLPQTASAAPTAPLPPLTEGEMVQTRATMPAFVVESVEPVKTSRLVLDSHLTTISFEKGSVDLSKEGRAIADNLVKALTAYPRARLTLTAYADVDGQMSPREARHLSLNRALAIRDYMTQRGIPTSRIDLRPMGANIPSGNGDRVDVKVN
ncbi:MAG: OmpA family protein [Alphaproteobacteria bacterium]|nr:OmpA family protein [Alphaproteobacteria bacterium]